ncbi:MAG TPA: FUSC family protein [Stellaceae bacterium]|nr:FUSC family protein [Stellaceae bacterium]
MEVDGHLLALDLLRRAGGGAEAAQDDRDKAAVHRPAHDVGQDRARGLCVYAAGLLDGNRAYAAVLSGYTVALIAIQQLDTPQHVFASGVARGAAIAVGIVALAVVNDLLAAPDSHPQLALQLAALHRRVRDYAKAVIRDEATDPATAAGLLRDIAALRAEVASLATESASGSIRSAAARSTAVALVAELHAARALDALPVTADPAFRDRWLRRWTGGAASPRRFRRRHGTTKSNPTHRTPSRL